MKKSHDILEKKRQELEKELVEWANANSLLKRGQVLEFAVNIRTTRAILSGEVEIFGLKTITPIRLARVRNMPNAKFEYIEPARLSLRPRRILLEHFSGTARNILERLLVERKNQPTPAKELYGELGLEEFWNSFRMIERVLDRITPELKLAKPLERGVGHNLQLWVVRKKDSPA